MSRVVKIAPGKGAKYWGNNDCLENAHICVGWDKVGDLRKFSLEDDLRAAVNRDPRHSVKYGFATLDPEEFKLRRQSNCQQGQFDCTARRYRDGTVPLEC
jgi:hypothetical protein